MPDTRLLCSQCGAALTADSGSLQAKGVCARCLQTHTMAPPPGDPAQSASEATMDCPPLNQEETVSYAGQADPPGNTVELGGVTLDQAKPAAGAANLF